MMSTPQEQVQCMLWLIELQSCMAAVQHCFRMQYGCQPPTLKPLSSGTKKLRTTDSLLRVKFPGKIRTSEENVNRIREAFQESLHKSIHAASLQLHTNSTFNSA
jgi:hypothetical protein